MRSSACLLFLLTGVASGQGVPLPPELPLRTGFAAAISPEKPRPEYPRPQMVRAGSWMSLNGPWEFWVGSGESPPLTIRVPFAPECALSGLFRDQEVMERVRYRRRFELPAGWPSSPSRTLLHFEAVDWEARVTVDGREAGSHRGGYDRWSLDITELLGPGPDHLLEVEVFDPADPETTGRQPRGKQLGSHGIWYTRTTGIWQSVWLEAVPAASIDSLEIRADAAGGLWLRASVSSPTIRWPAPLKMQVKVLGEGRRGRPVRHEIQGSSDQPLQAHVPDVQPWSPSSPVLYDLEVRLVDEDTTWDLVRSYTGFRTVAVREGFWTLNGEPLFIRGVLDQGYWPEGGLTAPSDEALRHDVELARRLGFNLARKHVKVEDARWYSWCDRLGLMVMQDMPSSMNLDGEEARAGFLRELEGMVRKVGSHPSVVHWVAFNEDWGRPGPFQDQAVDHLRALDPTRPVTDASGWTQRENTDVTDVHDYGADLGRHAVEQPIRPKIIGECGGVGFWQQDHVWAAGWGYTTAPSAEAFLRRIARLARQPYEAAGLSGFVWTQLSDVEQELNGLVHYDRTPKVEEDRLRRAILGLARPPELLLVKQWLILGPIPAGAGVKDAARTPENLALLRAALHEPWLREEASLRPSEGTVEAVGGIRLTWKQLAPGGSTIDLAAFHGGTPSNCVSFAAGTLRLDQPMQGSLLFGSDDAARVWLDGKRVHEIIAVRGVALGQDEVPGLTLAAGEHRIVVKVAQGLYGFGFALAFEPEGEH